MNVQAVHKIKQFIVDLPRSHRVLISSVSALLFLLLFVPTEQATASKNSTKPEQLLPGQRYQLDLVFEPEQQVDNQQPELFWQTYVVKSGDSLAKIFDTLGFSAQQLYRVTHSGSEAKKLRNMHPGDELRIATDSNDELVQLVHHISGLQTLIITRQNEDFVSEIETREVETRTEFAHAVIDSSFWSAAMNAGMTDNQIMSVANIFGWDIDFALDLRKGDEFSVLFEREFVDGEFVGYGKILAAEFVNQGEVFQAVLNAENGRYYTPEGRAMRKTFLRSPVNFTYVSSNFNPRRLHPVTGRVRPHNGTDYVAAVGTPVMSAGDGRVIKASYNSLNGNYVFIQHGERYVTKYLHLSRKHVKTGDRVSQGQIIGRVGSTGRVTGAHLHYEFLVNGVHRNPRTVELPKAKSLSESELPAFRAHAQQLVAVLNDNKRIYLAMR
ncbi:MULTISPECIES: peptidoglycan DD-metalloendopeptidase family protein [Idiomarina]|jgi:murein DD-endopeptidase MepM/ murein hydrolase activator NlpD|uniref:Peptidase M23 n=2 Tax=Idiomarina baltica TaxID=190892 RepID=A0A348WMT0_9GAMM|nr:MULTISPECIES: peptidoglycan DD-metalloendopeptidase family protein [Idiomarina]MAF74396.1 peptidase M23 [Idiomarinaceae bacterium]MEC8925694.1 peptidoglycan DD-metalloendopeptidase family protein [Pseudomonadota bacterium]EAQ32357.1 Peptidase, M23/M37 family protein [Idiomarina baltica OS145]KXS36161.1 MAG: M23/M37 family peptidase [Idiomarina sp. T82-3]MBL74796.1 peptidase M23 [Idiomarinaceae bacterium]|tara:strand:- start:818 stop:2134 length:1317 start_codon:yes stop_codon:yes gene_type:complete